MNSVNSTQQQTTTSGTDVITKFLNVVSTLEYFTKAGNKVLASNQALVLGKVGGGACPPKYALQTMAVEGREDTMQVATDIGWLDLEAYVDMAADPNSLDAEGELQLHRMADANLSKPGGRTLIKGEGLGIGTFSQSHKRFPSYTVADMTSEHFFRDVMGYYPEKPIRPKFWVEDENSSISFLSILEKKEVGVREIDLPTFFLNAPDVASAAMGDAIIDEHYMKRAYVTHDPFQVPKVSQQMLTPSEVSNLGLAWRSVAKGLGNYSNLDTPATKTIQRYDIVL